MKSVTGQVIAFSKDIWNLKVKVLNKSSHRVSLMLLSR